MEEMCWVGCGGKGVNKIYKNMKKKNVSRMKNIINYIRIMLCSQYFFNKFQVVRYYYVFYYQKKIKIKRVTRSH